MAEVDDPDLIMKALETALSRVEQLQAQVGRLQREIESFSSQRGPRGYPGKDGYRPVKGVDYFDGKPGAPGRNGVSVKAVQDDDERFIIQLDDGLKFPIKKLSGRDGYTPQKGVDYFDGLDGKSVEGAFLRSGHLIFVIDGEEFDVGRVVGEKGDKGDRGATGPKGDPGGPPEHQIKSDANSYKLRFRQRTGRWGNWITIPRKQTINMLSGGSQAAPQIAVPPRMRVIYASTDQAPTQYPRNLVRVDTTNGDVRITLPAKANDYDMEFIIKKYASDNNTVIVDTADGRLINGELEFRIEFEPTAIQFVDNGTEWDAV